LHGDLFCEVKLKQGRGGLVVKNGLFEVMNARGLFAKQGKSYYFNRRQGVNPLTGLPAGKGRVGSIFQAKCMG